MSKVIMMSYKDYVELWNKFYKEADMSELVCDLPENATSEQVHARQMAILVAKACGRVLPRICLEITGMFKGDQSDSWKQSEELFNATQFTSELVPLLIAKVIGMPLNPGDLKTDDQQTISVFDKIDPNVLTFWVNKWMAHMLASESTEEVNA